VPETDFVGFVADSGVTALIMSIAVVLIVAGLTGLLAWRNVLAERRAAVATTRQQALETRTQTFIDLAHDAVAADAEEAGLSRATESAAAACAAKRVAIWRLSRDGRTLTCEDCFDSTVHEHTTGLALHRDEMPNLFAALAQEQAIDTGEAGQDKRTSELFASYLQPLEISSVYIAPILMAGRLLGMLSIEDPQRGDRAAGLATFCDALSILLALRFTAAAAPASGAPRATVVAAAAAAAAESAAAPAEAPSAFAQRQTRLERTLLAHNAPMESLIESAIDRAAVGVIKLPNWTTVAQRPSDTGQRTAMDVIVHELRRTIETSGVCYAALLDDQIVLAAFLRDRRSVEGHATCMAAAMLELRDRLIELEDRWSTSLDFRLAIDIGMIMASTVGTDPPSRNLWGGAIGIAKVLAGTTARRTIAASETAYDLLSNQFLFRPRGSYFLPETGNMRTFVMVGRI
jgi:adenylate cyclase